MKTTISATMFASLCLLSGLSHGADTFSIDGTHAAAIFRVNHQGFSYTYGRFNKISGEFTLDKAIPGKNSISVEIEADSIDTDLDKRDQHLRGPDFFNVRQFPKMTFKSTAIKKTGDVKYSVTGDFSLRGVTKSITIDVDKVGEGEAYKGQYRAGFETKFVIKRSDYGMSYGLKPGGVGDEITIMVSFEGVRK